jgi:hypothetical protein
MIKNTLKNSIFKIIYTQIFLIFILSLVLRLLFIYVDYPFLFHPDEPTVVNSTINLRYDLNPGHFDWPTFYYYFTFPFFYVYEKVYFLLIDFGFIDNKPIDNYNYYLISRVITSFFGASTSICVFLILKNLKLTRSLCLLGACVISLIPFHVTRSAQALTDVPMLFFASVSIYYLTKNLDVFLNKNFYFSCFFAGLAVSTKYNAYMIFLSLALYIFLIKGFSLKDIKIYLISGFIAFFGFLIGTPYSLIDYTTFFSSEGPKGALWQFANVGKVDFPKQLENFYINTNILLSGDMGYIPLLFSILFILIFFIKKDYKESDSINRIILIFVLQFIFIIWSVSGVRRQETHYLILSYLFLPIFSVLLFEKLKEKYYLKYFGYVLVVLFCLFELYIKIGNLSIVEFYNRAVFKGDKSKYMVIYNRSQTGDVLEKLGIPSDKIKYIPTYTYNHATHAITTYEICPTVSPCNFVLIEKIKSRSNPDIIYVYKRK